MAGSGESPFRGSTRAGQAVRCCQSSGHAPCSPESLERGVPTRVRKWQWEDAKDCLEGSILYIQRAGVGIQLPVFFPRVSLLLLLLLFPHFLASSLHRPSFPYAFSLTPEQKMVSLVPFLGIKALKGFWSTASKCTVVASFYGKMHGLALGLLTADAPQMLVK